MVDTRSPLPAPGSPAAGRFDPSEVAAALGRLGLDGWLVFDFHGSNPIAARLVGGASGLGFTRRLFVWLPREDVPTVLVHDIDAHLVPDLGGSVVRYGTWQDLHEGLRSLIAGRRVAMEISADNAVPYLDRVPAGLVQLVTGLGATVVSSEALVSAFAARWTEPEQAEHRRVAELLAGMARDTLSEVVRLSHPATEIEVQRRVLETIERAGLSTPSPPIVAFGTHSANPHHEPSERGDEVLQPDTVVLLDLWARPSGAAVWADQTWMAYSGSVVPSRVTEVWEAVRDARDRVVATLAGAYADGGRPITGAALDDAARDLLRDRGFAEHFVHRTGHSIDAELHGSGPHLDNYETHDTRSLVPGVAFSIEPGVYLAGEFGVRSEVNVVIGSAGPEVTPREVQRDLIRPV